MPPLLLRLIFHRVKKAPVPFFVKPIAKAIANKVLSEFVNPNIDRLLDFIDTSLKGKQWFLGDQLSGSNLNAGGCEFSFDLSDGHLSIVENRGSQNCVSAMLERFDHVGNRVGSA